MSQNIVSINSNSTQSQLHEMLVDLVNSTLEALPQIADRDQRFNAHCNLCEALESPNVIQSLYAVQTVIDNYHLSLSSI